MKKFGLIALLILLTLPIVQSCKKDILEEEATVEVSNLTARAGNTGLSKETYTDRFGNLQDILVFATKEDYQFYLTSLENKIAANPDADEYYFALDFDRTLGFNSLLNDYIAAENSWLMTDDLPYATDPDNHFYDLDAEELALLNKDRAVKVEGKILVYFDDGYVTITNGDCTIINELMNYQNARSLQSLANQARGGGWLVWVIYIIITINDWIIDGQLADGTTCKTRNYYRRMVRRGNRKYKVRTVQKRENSGTWSYPKIKLKMVSYKKRRWVGWKKVKANLKIELDGSCGEKSCSMERVFNHDYREEYTKKLKHSWGTYDSRSFFTQDNQLYGYFYVDNQLIRKVDIYDGSN